VQLIDSIRVSSLYFWGFHRYNDCMNYENEYLLVGSEALSREFNDLADYYSDFHKDVYGVRPRMMSLCACDYPDHQSLVEAMSLLKRLVDGIRLRA